MCFFLTSFVYLCEGLRAPATVINADCRLECVLFTEINQIYYKKGYKGRLGFPDL